MKETDYSVICAQVNELLNDSSYDMEDIWGHEISVMLVANIYMMNDLCTGYGQDIRLATIDPESHKNQRASVVSATDLVSVILPEGGSHYRADLPLCGYENLHDDIYNILIIIQAVIDRIYANAYG